jgi:hypothetical protein
MNRIDAEAPRQSTTRRPRRNGDEMDAFAADHRLAGYRPGQRAAIRARSARSERTAVRVQLARYATV